MYIQKKIKQHYCKHPLFLPRFISYFGRIIELKMSLWAYRIISSYLDCSGHVYGLKKSHCDPGKLFMCFYIYVRASKMQTNYCFEREIVTVYYGNK